MILADSNVWIDYFRYFRSAITPQTEKLDGLLGSEPLAIGDLILAEVLQCFADETKFRTSKEASYIVDGDRPGRPERCRLGGETFSALRKLGVIVRKTIDVINATRCLENDYGLLHSDRDFDPFVKHLGLRSIG